MEEPNCRSHHGPRYFRNGLLSKDNKTRNGEHFKTTKEEMLTTSGEEKGRRREKRSEVE